MSKNHGLELECSGLKKSFFCLILIIFSFVLYDPVQGPQEDDSLLVGGFGPLGNTTYAMQLDTSGSGLALSPGTYVTQILICNGECGSAHPHSRIFSTMNSTFVLT